MILAAFATTPAGYISGLLFPIFGLVTVTVGGVIINRHLKRSDDQEARLRKAEDALTLLTYIVNELKDTHINDGRKRR